MPSATPSGASRGATARLSLLLFACLFAAQSAFLVLGPILPAVARDFETSSAVAGQLRTFSGVAGGVAALALAALGFRLRLRVLLQAGLWSLVLASLVSALAPSYTVLAVAQLAIGVGIAILLSGAVAGAAAYFPGTFLARRWAESRSREPLIVLGLALSVGTAVFGMVRTSLWSSALLFAAIVLIAGGRTLAGSAHGLIAARGRSVDVTSVRAAATQFGNLLGVGLGGVALAAGGYGALGAVVVGLPALGLVPHVAPALSGPQRRRAGLDGRIPAPREETAMHPDDLIPRAAPTARPAIAEATA